MTISEYEYFGVSNYANEKNTHRTISEGISGMAEENKATAATKEKGTIGMVKETEIKSAALCALALLAGLCCAALLGCKTSAKVEGGAEIIELKPLELQELTFPVYDYSKIC